MRDPSSEPEILLINNSYGKRLFLVMIHSEASSSHSSLYVSTVLLYIVLVLSKQRRASASGFKFVTGFLLHFESTIRHS